nr:MAG TPA: hypothetical protein [Caudoviricetes sp.]
MSTDGSQRPNLNLDSTTLKTTPISTRNLTEPQHLKHSTNSRHHKSRPYRVRTPDFGSET